MRQRKKVSGIGDVLLHFAIFPAHLSGNWFRRAMFNALSRRFPLPQSAAQVHHSPLPRNEQRYEMGGHAQSAWIIRVFAALLAVSSLALAPALVHAAATAQGVALNAGAGCSNGNLDITLTTAGANWEKWQATDPAGSTFSSGQGSAGLPTFSGTGLFTVPFSPSPPPNTLVASYAYVGEQMPDASNTAEFFVFYNCTTRQVLLSCFGPYGTCPQTAQQALVALLPKVPALSTLGLLVTIMLVAGAGGRALSRRT